MPLLARYLGGAVAAVGAIALVGCASPADLGVEYARNSNDDLLEPTVFHSHAYEIVQFAEYAQAATEDSEIVMLGVDEAEDDNQAADEAIGWLRDVELSSRTPWTWASRPAATETSRRFGDVKRPNRLL